MPEYLRRDRRLGGDAEANCDQGAQEASDPEALSEGDWLRLPRCLDITSKAAICLCTNAKSLASLDVSFVRGISNQAMTYAVDSLPSLKTLVVWGCTQLDFFFNVHSKNDLLVVGRHL